MNNVVRITLISDLLSIHEYERRLLQKINNSAFLGGGMYQRIMSNEIVEHGLISEMERCYLLHRLYFKYSNTKNISSQISNVVDRKKMVKKKFEKFLHTIDRNITKSEADSVFEQIQNSFSSISLA